MYRTFILISIQVLSGKHPWSEIRNDAAVMLRLSKGIKPERPSSRLIEDKHWELIERCWSSVDDRPCATDVVSSLQQFLHSYSAFPPLLDTFRLLSNSSIFPPQSPLVVSTWEQLIGTPQPGLPEATLDHQSVVFNDGKHILPMIGLVNSRLLRLYGFSLDHDR